jgi:hypothetical protein
LDHRRPHGARLFVRSIRFPRRRPFEKGNFDLTLSGTGANDKDFNDGSFNVNVGLGYFISNEVEVAVRQSGGYSDGWSGSTAIAADYNFDLNSKLVPFVGVSVGYTYGDGVNNTWSAGPEVGVRYFLNSSTYVQANGSYQFNLDDGIDSGGFTYGLGIGFRW